MSSVTTVEELVFLVRNCVKYPRYAEPINKQLKGARRAKHDRRAARQTRQYLSDRAEYLARRREIDTFHQWWEPNGTTKRP